MLAPLNPLDMSLGDDDTPDWGSRYPKGFRVGINFATLAVLIQAAGRGRGRRPAARLRPERGAHISPDIPEDLEAALEPLRAKWSATQYAFTSLALAPLWQMIDNVFPGDTLS